jgi:predicted metal-dependent phosphoesterase TrpH
MALVDLHAHSTASDGTVSPAGICSLAAERSLAAFALTDHDTLDGIPEALGASGGAVCGMPVFVSGVELSVNLVAGSSAHLLGYFPSAGAEALCDRSSPLGRALERVRQARNKRNPAILERLGSLGFQIREEEVTSLAGGDVVGRPHIAQAMLNRGFVGSTREAFDRFLARGRPAYVERERLGETEALDLIRGAGGLPVLAHPGLLGREREALRSLIRSMRERGLGGVEAYYPRHSAELSAYLVELCSAEGLVVTGGTDFHGLGDDPSRFGGSPGSFEVMEEQVGSFLDLCRSSCGG